MSGMVGFANPIARGLFNAASWVENQSRRLKGLPALHWGLTASGFARGRFVSGGLGRLIRDDEVPAVLSEGRQFPPINHRDKAMGFGPGKRD